MKNPQDDKSRYEIIHRLKTKFSTPGSYLTIAIPPGRRDDTLPPDGGAIGLFRVRGRQYQRIEQMEELAGRVRIESPEAALSFARLYTSPRTYYLFPKKKMPALRKLGILDTMEVIPHTWLNEVYFFGDKDMRETYRIRVTPPHEFFGFEGIVKYDPQNKGLEFATVTRERGGFSIRRPLMTREGHYENGVLAAVEEWVGSSGQFNLEKVTYPVGISVGPYPLRWPGPSE